MAGSMRRSRPKSILDPIIRLRRAGRLREAVAELHQLAHQHPRDAMVCFYLAVTLDNLGRERKAIPRYHRALRLDPRHPHAREICLYLATSPAFPETLGTRPSASPTLAETQRAETSRAGVRGSPRIAELSPRWSRKSQRARCIALPIASIAIRTARRESFSLDSRACAA